VEEYYTILDDRVSLNKAKELAGVVKDRSIALTKRGYTLYNRYIVSRSPVGLR
jgi:hypothetical protein